MLEGSLLHDQPISYNDTALLASRTARRVVVLNLWPLLTPSPGEVYQSVTASIEYADVAMLKARTGVERAQASKENRRKVVSKASEIVNILLDPALQVANLLDGIGGLFPPCKVASNTLAVRAVNAIFRGARGLTRRRP